MNQQPKVVKQLFKLDLMKDEVSKRERDGFEKNQLCTSSELYSLFPTTHPSRMKDEAEESEMGLRRTNSVQAASSTACSPPLTPAE